MKRMIQMLSLIGVFLALQGCTKFRTMNAKTTTGSGSSSPIATKLNPTGGSEAPITAENGTRSAVDRGFSTTVENEVFIGSDANGDNLY